MPRIRMCDADRERYGGPEWVELESADLTSEAAGVIEQIEEVFDMTPGEFLTKWRRGSIKALRAGIWVARWKAGVRENPHTFRPLTQPGSGVTYEPTPAEAKLRAELATQLEEAAASPPANRATRRAAAKKAPAKKATRVARTAASKS
jgi:hypothetical protein